MKLISVFVLILSIQVSAKTYSQTVTISEKNVSLQKIFRQINKQIDYNFLYTDELLENTKKVSIQAKNAPLAQVLEECFANQPLTYRVVNNTIVLKPKVEGDDNNAPLPPLTITGKVVDENGESLIGVTVKIKNTGIGTTTDVSGNFAITIPSGGTGITLEVSYLGYFTQEVAADGKAKLTIQLKPNSKSLNEIVVVGYNVVKKSDVTGAVISVSEAEIRSRPVSNALEAMQGKAAGVDITSSQRPGQLGAIMIRGARSLTSGNSPLYVVDGVPLQAGGIEAINPNDIQTIDILKDASATAIYGSRGANGVIIVTTKRGKAGNLSLSYTGTATLESLHDRTQMMNSAQYIEFRRDAYRRINYVNTFNGATTGANTGYSNPTGPSQVDDQRIFGGDPFALANVNKGWVNGTFDGSLVPTTDWTGMVKRRALTQNHTVSAAGGTDKIRAYGSFGYLYQDGTQLGQNYERYTGNFSVDINPTKWFAMGGSINLTNGYQNYGYTSSSPSGATSLYAAAQGQLPYAIPFNPNTGERINTPGGDVGILNPIGEEQNNITQNKSLRTLASIYGELTPLPGLRVRSVFGPDISNYNNGQFQSASAINRGGGQPGSTNLASLNQGTNTSYTWDNLVYYNKTIKKHDFGATLLYSESATRLLTSGMSAVNVPYDKQLWYQLNSVSALNTFSTNLTETSIQSYMARVNYTYNGKYLLTASIRKDGSSVLPPGHKSEYFPSLALAWRIDQEAFLKKIEWIDQLKVRFGVGNTGNSAIRAYTSEGQLQALYYTYGSSVVAGYVASDASLANPIPFPNGLLGWEHTTQYNFGIDFGLFRGRLSGVIDFYVSNTPGLILNQPIPTPNGYSSTYANIGGTSNRGIDITLNSVNIKTKDFNWSSNLSFAANRDKVDETSLGKADDISNSWFIGQRLSVYYDYQKIGIWQNTPEDLAEIAKYKANGQTFIPGQIKVKDINGDHKIDLNNDRTVVGHSAPDWTGGLNNIFDYKSFEFAIFLYARWGYTFQTGNEFLQGRYAQRVLNYWTPTNPTNEYPAPNYNSAAGDAYASTLTYQNGSYIAIRNISLGYFLPKSITQKLSVSSIKVYLQAANPALLYSNIGWINPDLNASYYNKGGTFGVNVGF